MDLGLNCSGERRGSSASEMPRRKFMAAVTATFATIGRMGAAQTSAGGEMYGQMGRITVVAGKRDEFIKNLLEGIADMRGCMSYVVAKDAKDIDTVWISEAWDSKASHDASLSLPAVKEAIAKNRPLIAGFGDGIVTIPVGGVGLSSPKSH